MWDWVAKPSWVQCFFVQVWSGWLHSIYLLQIKPIICLPSTTISRFIVLFCPLLTTLENLEPCDSCIVCVCMGVRWSNIRKSDRGKKYLVPPKAWVHSTIPIVSKYEGLTFIGFGVRFFFLIQETPIFGGKKHVVSCRFSLKPLQWHMVYLFGSGSTDHSSDSPSFFEENGYMVNGYHL